MMFEFKRLIDKYSVSFSISYPGSPISGDNVNEYDDLGNPITPTAPSEQMPSNLIGALLPIKQNVIYQSGGRLTEADRMLYTTNHDIPLKSKISYKGFVYSVESKMPYEDVADFSSYVCKGVSSFGD
jgi:hypothetical protein